MAIDFEKALAGEHGEEAKAAAEMAVSNALDQIAGMFKPSAEAGLSVGGTIGSFATGGLFKAPATTFRFNNGEVILPKPR